MKILKSVFANVCALLLVASFVSFSRAASVEDITLYNKPDRQKVLIDGARKERASNGPG